MNAALKELRARYHEAVASAERYRDLAEASLSNKDFLQAVAVTYERCAKEIEMVLDKAEKQTVLKIAA